MKRSERITGFTEAIWEWYARHKRSLPWRDLPIPDDNERAYRILVSEVMLQQTQVSRVQTVFKLFLEKFGSMEELASANNRDVLLAWRGMGYNSRALRLRDAVRTIVKEHDGVFPREMPALLQIKGIGPYTAAAIRNFAWNIPTPCIDTNIRRILHRTFIGPEEADGTWKVSDRELLLLAQEVLDVAIDHQSLMRNAKCEMQNEFSRTTANWHAALMDFGSLVQTKNNPKWDLCPLTARRLMRTTPNVFVRLERDIRRKTQDVRISKEPGRFVGSRFIPNRIFRGRIIEALRDAPQGMKFNEIGSQICIDWNEKEHKEWLMQLINKLIQEGMMLQKKNVFVLNPS